MDEIPDEKFYSVKEFAKLLNVSQETVRKAIRKGNIIAVKPGGGRTSCLRIPRVELDRMALRLLNQ